MSYPTPAPGAPATAVPAFAPPAPASGRPENNAGYTTPSFFRDTSLGRLASRAFRVCASLQLAVSLLSFLAVCLAGATLIESAATARIAQDLVYRTWWFALLLFFLAVNVLCAALKKYPWKRHQTGFLITHAGLLVLIFGAFLTTLGGVDGQMTLVDTDNPAIQQQHRLTGRSDMIQFADRHQIEVFRVPKQATRDPKLLDDLRTVIEGGLEPDEQFRNRFAGNHWNYTLSPGSFAWHADEHFTPRLPWALRALAAVADPFPGFARTLDEKASLKVENYYPHAESWPFSPAGKDEEDSFPALLLRLETPVMPRPVSRWVTSLPHFGRDPGPVSFEMLVAHEPSLVPEFLNPPPAEKLGKAGQLVLIVGSRRTVCRLNLDDLVADKPVELPDTGLIFTLKKRGHVLELLGDGPDEATLKTMPLYPSVQFELARGAGRGTYLACARLPHLAAFRDGEEVEQVAVWYHYPDFRWGLAHRMGALQLLHVPGDRLYCRIYGKDGLKGPGRALETDPDAVHELPWKPMDMKFQVAAWLPKAVQREWVRPRHVRPGSEPAERLEPALRCTLESGGEKKEFWVRLSHQATQVIVGKEMFFIRYRAAARQLDFSLTLKRARQVSDPGTNRPASFESDVVLHAGPAQSEHTIRMNHTLDHGGFKVYQTNYRPLVDPRTGAPLLDEDGRLVSLSGFTVADDPGLVFKYAGSCLLVLGIATMFTMRAYFFKPRGASA